MSVVIFLVTAVILGGIVVVAMGRGGELARDKIVMPATADLRTWSDVARYRPPPALLGYHAASTEQALMMIAKSIAERDAEIAWLRGKLAEFQPESAPGDRPTEEDRGASEGSNALSGLGVSEDSHAVSGPEAPEESDPPVRTALTSEAPPEAPVQAGFLPQAGQAARAGDE